eukprot:176100-Prymnesium_polylepis.2
MDGHNGAADERASRDWCEVRERRRLVVEAVLQVVRVVVLAIERDVDVRCDACRPRWRRAHHLIGLEDRRRDEAHLRRDGERVGRRVVAADARTKRDVHACHRSRWSPDVSWRTDRYNPLAAATRVAAAEPSAVSR